jgi:hypothetical protein
MYCSNLSCKFSRQTQKKLVGFSHYGHFSCCSRISGPAEKKRSCNLWAEESYIRTQKSHGNPRLITLLHTNSSPACEKGSYSLVFSVHICIWRECNNIIVRLFLYILRQKNIAFTLAQYTCIINRIIVDYTFYDTYLTIPILLTFYIISPPWYPRVSDNETSSVITNRSTEWALGRSEDSWNQAILY